MGIDDFKDDVQTINSTSNNRTTIAGEKTEFVRLETADLDGSLRGIGTRSRTFDVFEGLCREFDPWNTFKTDMF